MKKETGVTPFVRDVFSMTAHSCEEKKMPPQAKQFNSRIIQGTE